MAEKDAAQLEYEEQLLREYEQSLVTQIGDLTFQPPREVLPKTKRTEELERKKMQKLKERKEEEEQKLRIKEQEEAQKRMKEQQQKKQKQQEEMKKREEERRRREEEEQRKQLEGGLDRILESLNANDSNPAIGLCGIELGSVRLRLLATALKKNTSCMSIDFGRKQLNDEDGVSLADMLMVNKHLEKLELEGNNLGIKTGLALGEALGEGKNDSLRCLNLESNNITSSGNDQKGIIDIAEALSHNRSLRVLNLARNHITVQGGDYLVKALQHNETITLIDLSGNELGIDQLRQVDAIVQRNRERLSHLRRRERQERFKLFNEEFASRQYDMEVEAERLERDAIEERRLQRMRQRFLDWRTDCEERIKSEQEMYENLLDEAKDRAENRKGKKGKKKKK